MIKKTNGSDSFWCNYDSPWHELYLICTNWSWRQPGASKYHQTSPPKKGAVQNKT